ncbi:MAG: hypothetical protein OHK93_004892 [Ramalina farinacea]|uniref:Phosphoribosyltransferase domain-containing protein n=1 Tax=Ramalina farinacea TaxID=258253 RepID=A0AA43QV25_9LECA|nr:hypothetical protein [Ramalina farinacea]
MGQLKEWLGHEDFTFHEGSEQIAKLVPGGLEAFKKMKDNEKEHWRKLAIETIGKESAESGKPAIVTGHYMFWSDEEAVGSVVCTKKDLDVYTHILYLDVPVKWIVDRRRDDKERARPPISKTRVEEWQEFEKRELRRLCREYGILFSLVSPDPTSLSQILRLLQDFRVHSEEYNLIEAKRQLDDAIQSQQNTVLVIDGDRTLATGDTGALFWKAVSKNTGIPGKAETLKDLFSGELKYSYTAFRQATLLCEEAIWANADYVGICDEVARAVTIHPEFVSLLTAMNKQKHVGAIVVTCGLGLIWERIVQKANLAVKVIGGGRITDRFVVTAAVKADLVEHLQKTHQMRVWAFGDSPLDLPMLAQADQAFIVVGEAQTRSKSMDAALASTVLSHQLHGARQVLLPGTVEPRLTALSTINLDDPSFLDTLFAGQATVQENGLEIVCAADKNDYAAKLLATPMRDAANAGPALRTAHRQVGWYLAIEHVTTIIGLESRPIQHVLGRPETGSRLRHEKRTTIVALMRGGEPMATGVSDAFPLAWFVHAKEPEDIKLHHLKGQETVILVDSVVNTGKSIVDAVRHIRKLHATVRIMIVAGVVQKECVSKHVLKNELAQLMGIHLVTLRYSDTKFTGSKATDTGNRLFNTTHLD